MADRLVEKVVLGHRFFVVDPSSMGYSEHSTAEFDDFEPPFLAHWPEIRPGDVVVDAGAQFGVYSMTALAMGARVVAYEPTEYGARLLAATADANGWSPCFTIRRAALWNGTPYPSALLGQVFGKHYPTTLDFPTVRLDDDLRALGVERVDWLKSDVEGAELGLLEGARGTLERDRPTLIVEDHESVSSDPNDQVSRYPETVQSRQRIHAMLRELGYRLDVMPFDVSRFFIVAKHPTRWPA